MSEKTDQSSIVEWFASLSHDLRNPLHGILSYASFGIKKTGNGQLTEEKSLHYYQSIKDAGSKLLDLLNDITLLAKLDSGRIEIKPAEWNLGTVVQGVISSVSPKLDAKTVSLVFEEPETAAVATFDSKQIGDVIRRLLDSCTRTIVEPVSLTMRVKSLDTGSPENRLGKPAVGFILEHPDVDYSDQRWAEIQQLLNRGNSDKKPGEIGLSLAICNRIIGLHGGWIGVEKTGDGVVFGFTLVM